MCSTRKTEEGNVNLNNKNVILRKYLSKVKGKYRRVRLSGRERKGKRDVNRLKERRKTRGKFDLDGYWRRKGLVGDLSLLYRRKFCHRTEKGVRLSNQLNGTLRKEGSIYYFYPGTRKLIRCSDPNDRTCRSICKLFTN